MISRNLQEAEAEKASILEQFEDAAKQKAEIDAQQKVLLTKMNAIKKQLDEYQDRRRAIGVSAVVCSLWTRTSLRLVYRRKLRMPQKTG